LQHLPLFKAHAQRMGVKIHYFCKALFLILVDALCGMFNTRVRGGCRRERSPHANELCEQNHASKADATKVARMSGGRAISRERPERVPTALAPLRFLSRERKLGKESELSRTPRWACLIDAFLEKSFAKNSVE